GRRPGSGKVVRPLRGPPGARHRDGTVTDQSRKAPAKLGDMARDRWATFDCYGTLIDWNGGIRRELGRVFGDEHADEQLERYHDVEPALQADGKRTYREVMTAAMRELGAPEEEADGLARSLPSWELFPEVRESLEEARRR